jgi:hypothetical protein
MTKLKLKVIAAAAALASLAGGAQAAIESGYTQNGTLVLSVWNSQNNAWYLRDLGFTIDTFLPSLQTSSAGVNLNSGNTTNFSDATSWSTWYSAQSSSALRWNVTAVDSVYSLPEDVARGIVSSANPNESALPGVVTNFVGESYAGGSEGYAAFVSAGTPGLSYYDLTGAIPFAAEFGLSGYTFGTDSLATIGQSVSLFFFSTDGFTLTGGRYGNSPTNFASVSLDADGNFSYTLAPSAVAEVPLPAAAWLMGAGLVGLGGVVRRRKQEAQA